MKTSTNNQNARNATLAATVACLALGAFTLPAAAQSAPASNPAQMEPPSGAIGPVKLPETEPAKLSADYDDSGVVDLFDLNHFMLDWLHGLQGVSKTGDVDGNGIVDPADVAAFITVWYPAILGIG